MGPPPASGFDDGIRRRLRARYGSAVDAWLEELPLLLASVAARWDIELGAVIPRGSMSAVLRCRLPDGRAAVLKISPDRERVASEAAALRMWTTPHVPRVVAVDQSVGALLLEAVEPGTPLVESRGFPPLANVADLLTSLHAQAVPESGFPPVARRVDALFDSWSGLRERKPELFDRGRRLAARLAADGASPVLLHGDLNPGNILDGGAERGLVAIDPAACVGDAAFDAVDIVFWQADGMKSIAARVESLADAIGADSTRLLAWCTAFAGMAVLDLAVLPAHAPEQLRARLDLAVEA